MKFHWKADGTQERGHSTLVEPEEQEGVIEAESMGEALELLIRGVPGDELAGLWWDTIDTGYSLTITIDPTDE